MFELRTQLAVAAIDEPVSLAEAKLHLRVTATDQDALIEWAIAVARERAEHASGRVLVEQEWLGQADAFPSGGCGGSATRRSALRDGIIVPPKQPLISVTWVKYVAIDGTLATLNVANYVVDAVGLEGRVYPAYGLDWPDTRDELNAVRIQWKAGYGKPEAVPRALKHWMLLQIGSLWEHRETIIAQGDFRELPQTFVDGLLAPYTLPRIG